MTFIYWREKQRITDASRPSGPVRIRPKPGSEEGSGSGIDKDLICTKSDTEMFSWNDMGRVCACMLRLGTEALKAGADTQLPSSMVRLHQSNGIHNL
jgi:hypothetical protein